MSKFSKVICLILALALMLGSCADTGSTDKDETVRVMVSADAGATVKSANPVEVKIGESAEFDVEIKNTYAFISVSYGTYNPETGKLKIENVTDRMNIEFKTVELGYDTTETTPYSFIGGSTDTSTQAPGPKMRFGTEITVKANDEKRIFVGWSFGNSISTGGTIASTDREYTFRASPDLVKKGLITVYANYKDSNILIYDPNGGTVNTSSANMSASEYYTADFKDGMVKITLGEKYYNFAECASTFYDDGTFTREGYVLIEYNTKPDGTGDSYSLGSKFYQGGMDDYGKLYCIWAEDSAHSDFTYTDHSMPLPSGVKAANATHWTTSGVIITGYNGDDKTVVIPEKINGKTVIAIAEGAFVNRQMSTLVLGRHIQSIADGAFAGCSSLETVYYPDGIYYITNDIFDEATYSNFKHLYVNASMAPRYAKAGDGVAVKLTRLLANQNNNRIIVVGGSSTLEGLSVPYLEALLDNKYTVINFGTTRTTHCLIYLEAMGALTHEGDIVVYSPENSSYQFGESELYWKSLRDLEGMYNFFRYIDISNYTNVFGSFGDSNRDYRYGRAPTRYEDICLATSTDKYGEHIKTGRDEYNSAKRFSSCYYVTLNNRCKTKFDEFPTDEAYQKQHPDYTDLTDLTWGNIDTPEQVALVNHSIAGAKSGGAKVYFGFCPVDGSSVVEAAQNEEWLLAYDQMIEDLYDFDGNLGSCVDYIFARQYFFDNAFHTNDYGKVFRTYRIYLDLIEKIGADMKVYGILDKGTRFSGCCFEKNPDGVPNHYVYFVELIKQ